MTLEQQVCSLELAKRLKKLGVKQESLFWWLDYKDERTPILSVWNGDASTQCWFAFTVAELGLLLPWYIESRFLEDADKWLKIEKDENVDGSVRWNISYQNEMGEDLFEVFDSNEANARAKMLIYLLENNLITL